MLPLWRFFYFYCCLVIATMGTGVSRWSWEKENKEGLNRERGKRKRRRKITGGEKEKERNEDNGDERCFVLRMKRVVGAGRERGRNWTVAIKPSLIVNEKGNCLRDVRDCTWGFLEELGNLLALENILAESRVDSRSARPRSVQDSITHLEFLLAGSG